MRLLTNTTEYHETIQIAKNLTITPEEECAIEPVLMHCYWSGDLSEKHLISIGTCFYFHGGKHKIILWLENNTPNHYNSIIGKWAEIRKFSYSEETKDADNLFDNYDYSNKIPAFYSDVVRYLLLYKYGGFWFDLDIFFLRSFDPIFYHYKNDICVYQWENQPYPNGAIYMCLEKRSNKLKEIIEYIRNNKSEWGFQNNWFVYDTPVDLLVLPCSWFDGSWIDNPNNMTILDFFKKTDKKYNMDNFFKGAFCYHWHNKWDNIIEIDSAALQLWEHFLPELKKDFQ